MLPGNYQTLADLIVGAGNLLAFLSHDVSSSGDSSEDSLDIDDDDDAFDNNVNPVEGLRLPWSCMTYTHDGDMLADMDSTFEDAMKHCIYLRATVYEKNGWRSFE